MQAGGEHTFDEEQLEQFKEYLEINEKHIEKLTRVVETLENKVAEGKTRKCLNSAISTVTMIIMMGLIAYVLFVVGPVLGKELK